MWLWPCFPAHCTNILPLLPLLAAWRCWCFRSKQPLGLPPLRLPTSSALPAGAPCGQWWALFPAVSTVGALSSAFLFALAPCRRALQNRPWALCPQLLPLPAGLPCLFCVLHASYTGSICSVCCCWCLAPVTLYCDAWPLRLARPVSRAYTNATRGPIFPQPGGTHAAIDVYNPSRALPGGQRSGRNTLFYAFQRRSAPRLGRRGKYGLQVGQSQRMHAHSGLAQRQKRWLRCPYQHICAAQRPERRQRRCGQQACTAPGQRIHASPAGHVLDIQRRSAQPDFSRARRDQG
jgi:hypothetical protein